MLQLTLRMHVQAGLAVGFQNIETLTCEECIFQGLAPLQAGAVPALVQLYNTTIICAVVQPAQVVSAAIGYAGRTVRAAGFARPLPGKHGLRD